MKKIINKKFNLPVISIYLIGVLFGIIFLFFISEVDKLIIKSEIEEYLNIVGSSKNTLSSILNSFKNNVLYLTIIWVSSITIIFAPIIFFVIFYKGFLSGFLISCFIMIFGIKGFLYSFLFTFPHEIINITSLILFSIIMFSISFKIMKSIYNNDTLNLRVFCKKVLIIYIIFLLVLLISSILEIYLNHFILGIFV